VPDLVCVVLELMAIILLVPWLFSSPATGAREGTDPPSQGAGRPSGSTALAIGAVVLAVAGLSVAGVPASLA